MLNVLIDLAHDPVVIVRMQPRFKGLENVGQFVVLVTQQFLQTWRKIDVVGQHVPIPQSIGRATHRQLEPLFDRS